MNTLKAKEGMYLTQLGEVENRIYATSVTGMTATYEYWRDAAPEENEEYEKEQEVINNDNNFNLENGNN